MIYNVAIYYSSFTHKGGVRGLVLGRETVYTPKRSKLSGLLRVTGN